MTERLNPLRQWMKERELDGLYLASKENRRYFSGFIGSNGHLFLSADAAVLVTDPRYTQQAEEEAAGWRIATHGLDPMPTLREEARGLRAKRIGFETDHLTDGAITRLRAAVPEVEWVPMPDYGLTLRAVKDEGEVACIRRAVAMGDRALMRLLPRLSPGMTEREIQMELEYLLAKEGSEGVAFDTIVASGPRSALPHGTATDRPIRSGEMVVVDFGAVYRGYHGDMTRTLRVGEPEPDLHRLDEVVHEALEEAVRAVRPGITAGELDRVHRRVFEAAGLERYSLRGLGHGVGLHIHERPRVVIGSEEILVPGMIFTLEPGLYVPGVGGVRIEDVVRVTEEGVEVLTQCPRRLQIH
ncbi:Xaa-Pro peptidase family protein [Gorillibacterium sp. CAU 1737]|uniref:M24 family metallopeptidase n=1 Tax=Gorillibacterium sp. CAU 1737 TaxID=3140362 RepID=UPI0032611EE0